jgi:hypothetical protein
MPEFIVKRVGPKKYGEISIKDEIKLSDDFSFNSY